MKTNQRADDGRKPSERWIRGFASLATLLAMVLVLSLAAAPAVMAGGPDGSYRLTGVSGKFTMDGETITIPGSVLKSGFLRQGRLVVSDSKIPIYPSKWKSLMDNFNYMGFTGSVSIKGPRSLVLHKAGSGYSGSTTRPVVLKISGDYLGMAITMTMKMKFKAKQQGDKLTITAPVSLDAMGLVTMKGNVRMVAKR